ncbi:hypothetical protein EDB81DRAFT_832725 [Dactylonectria macrodidyma]|uniref:Uncharacterized protein n=1 Tax=Dactylonectria macrodidyma TaxID=307937 RepID=A0A9P9CZZ2_9HYPO|nr:hypothetical protein EDB81DRAFT_832725 [Dactylonectria macrodidyma]
MDTRSSHRNELLIGPAADEQKVSEILEHDTPEQQQYRAFIDIPRPVRIPSQSRLLSHRFDKGAAILVSKTECIRRTHRPTRPKLRDAAVHQNIGAYIVIGTVDTDTGETLECLQELAGSDGKPKDLIASIHRAVCALRPWYIRLFTLKTVGAFGLYECHTPAGHHTILELSDTAKLALLELYYDFVAHRKDEREEWKAWVQKNLNSGDTFPGSRRLGLRLILKWSAWKIITYVSVPVIASLIFGLSYTLAVKGPDVDEVAVLQTAWTVSSYIVTTAGVIIAVLAAITSLKDH